MDIQFRLVTARQARSGIARLVLNESLPSPRIGSIVLAPHQVSAVARLRTALAAFNGAMLCDDVGMGKTYTALAAAADFSRRAIVAPAALIPMWRDSLARTGVTATLFTFESLSRHEVSHARPRAGQDSRYDLVVIDEAHHARNKATNRYFALASLVRGARVILVTATPIHNRRHDLVALLSLFLGSRAETMTTAELALCVVRRDHVRLIESASMPVVIAPFRHEVPDVPHVVEELIALPPPVPLRDGGFGGALIGRGLVHQWASSEAALREALRRRSARAVAICASLECGRLPSAGELATWIYGDGAVQLGFADLLSEPVVTHRELLFAVRTHLAGLDRIRGLLGSSTPIDDERARIIAEIRARHTGDKIIAFAQYSETVSMLFRRLVHIGRVALLTSHGARVAGGALARREAIDRFAPVANRRAQPDAAEVIDLLLTTDLLSEGVNLQDARVIVHLDVPWTPARMEQRVGRVARMGSAHSHVAVHILRPPPSADKVLASEAIIERKWRVAGANVGTRRRSPLSTDSQPLQSVPAKAERLRSILTEWIGAQEPTPNECLIASVAADRPGFIAVVSIDGRCRLVVSDSGEISCDLDAQLRVCVEAGSNDIPINVEWRNQAVAQILEWCEHQAASHAAGIGESNVVQRRRLTARIDEAIQSAMPQQRARRSVLATRARRVVSAQQCAAVEGELERLLQSEATTDDWLESVAALDSADLDSAPNATTDGPRVHALLLFGRGA